MSCLQRTVGSLSKAASVAHWQASIRRSVPFRSHEMSRKKGMGVFTFTGRMAESSRHIRSNQTRQKDLAGPAIAIGKRAPLQRHARRSAFGAPRYGQPTFSNAWLSVEASIRHYRVTLRDVIEAHEQALRFGGRPGVLDWNLIKSAIGRPYTGVHHCRS